MTTVNAYASRDELKHSNRLNIADSDSDADDMLDDTLNTASRDVDDTCHRWFYTDADSDDPQVFYYTALSPGFVFTDDIRTTTDLTIEIDLNGDGTYDQTLAATDYILEPANAVARGIPFQKIVIRTGKGLPVNTPNGVKVTAHFGWPSVPAPIKQATLLWAERLFMRGGTPLGSNSLTAFGQMTVKVPGDDPDVARNISRYIKTRDQFG